MKEIEAVVPDVELVTTRLDPSVVEVAVMEQLCPISGAENEAV